MIINKIKSIRQLNQVSLLLIFNISDIILPSGLFIEMHFNALQLKNFIALKNML